MIDLLWIMAESNIFVPIVSIIVASIILGIRELREGKN